MAAKPSPAVAEARQAVQRECLDRQELEWCADRIRAWSASAVELAEVRAVPSRLANVFRLVVRTTDGETALFFKSYGHSQSPESLTQRFHLLEAIQRALEGSARVVPVQVIAWSAECGYLLTREARGRSLMQIHRQMTRGLGAGEHAVAVRAWGGIGEWLGTLHWKTQPASVSTTRVTELAEYTRERFRRWGELDRRRTRLAEKALLAIEHLSGGAAGQPVTITPCHGDLNVSNVLVGTHVAVIDPDDMRLDMPGIDVSNALVEIQEYAYVGGLVPRRRLRRRMEEAFREGYGRDWLGGPDFWLPHLRNLAVSVLTLARRSRRASLDGLTEKARYLRTVGEIEHCVDAIGRGSHCTPR